MSTLITMGLAEPLNMTLASVAASALRVDLAFTTLVTLTGDSRLASNWQIVSTTTGAPVVVYGVTASGSIVTVSTDKQLNGDTYSLFVPDGIANTNIGLVFTGPFTQIFTGVGGAPAIVMARAVDARTLEIIFSVAVNESDALSINNYSINNGLSVLAVAKSSPNTYVLTTSQQTAGITYTVTASGIRDA